MKRIHFKHLLWAVLVLAGLSGIQIVALDEAKESSSESDSSPKIGFANQQESAKDITKKEAKTSVLIRSALDRDPQAQVSLNPKFCAGYSLDQIKQLLELLAAQNTEAIQAYLTEKNDLELYQLYRLSDYLGLDLSFSDSLITVLAKKIAALPEPKKSLLSSLKSWGSSLWGSSKKEQAQKDTYDQINAHFIEQLYAKLAFELLTHSQIIYGHKMRRSVAYSPDGTRIAFWSSDHTAIGIWNTVTWSLLSPLEGHKGLVLSVVYSPDGKRIASGSGDHTVRRWDASTGSPIGEPLRGHTDYVSSVAYSPDGKHIASGSDDETVKIWDARTGRLLHTLSGHTGRVKSVAYSPDGAHIASGSWDSTVRIWDARNGTLLSTLVGHKGYVVLVAYSSDGRHIASGSLDHTVRIWNAATGALVHTLEGHTGRVESVAYSPDGKQIASGSWDNTICIWDTTTGKQIGEPLRGHRDIVLSVAYSPDGRQIASGSFDRTVRIWDVRKGILLSTLVGHKEYILSVAYSPDGRHIASGSLDTTVRIWGEPDRQLEAQVKNWFSEMYIKQEVKEKTVRRIEPHRSKNFQQDRFVFDDLATEIVIKLENNQELQEQEKHSLREIQVLLAQALKKKTDEDASARPYTATDLPEILQAKTLYEGQRSYLLHLDALIDQVLSGIDPFAHASISAYTSVD